MQYLHPQYQQQQYTLALTHTFSFMVNGKGADYSILIGSERCDKAGVRRWGLA